MEAAGSACAPPRGEWTPSSTTAARKCILQGLHRDLQDWRRESCGGEPLPPTPDLDATLCRIRVAGILPERAGPTRHSLTNMMLVRSMAGRLSAATLLDRGDEGGPMRHWPARTLGALHMLAELQLRIDKGWLPKLPDFVAILNPHDNPEQLKEQPNTLFGGKKRGGDDAAANGAKPAKRARAEKLRSDPAAELLRLRLAAPRARSRGRHGAAPTPSRRQAS